MTTPARALHRIAHQCFVHFSNRWIALRGQQWPKTTTHYNIHDITHAQVWTELRQLVDSYSTCRGRLGETVLAVCSFIVA